MMSTYKLKQIWQRGRSAPGVLIRVIRALQLAKTASSGAARPLCQVQEILNVWVV